MKTTEKLLISFGAIMIGIAIPVLHALYFLRVLWFVYGVKMPIPALELSLYVASFSGIVLSVALWHLVMVRIWKWPSIRVTWVSATLLVLMYWQWTMVCFVCLCGTGAMISGIISSFLALLVVRFVMAFMTKDSPVGLLLYIPLLFVVPPYINQLVRLLSRHE